MGSATAAVRAVASDGEALEALRAWKPHSVRVVLVDGLERDVAVPARRNRWRIVGQILAGLPWASLEALDRKRAILGMLQREDAPEMTAEEAEPEPGGAVTVREQQLLELILKSQRVALDAQRELLKPLLDNQARLVATLTDRVLLLEQGLQDRMRAILRQANAAESEDDGGGELMSTGAIGMMLELAKLAQMSKSAPAAPPAPKNGSVRKGPPPATAKDANAQDSKGTGTA